MLTCDVDYPGASVPKRTVPLSPNVSKASAGVLEIFQPAHVIDPEAFLRLKHAQSWNIIGTSTDLATPGKTSYDLDRTKNSILVMGNEGYGVPDYLKPYCNSSIHIRPGRSLNKHFDSLNVSVASALLIQSLTSLN